MPEDTTAPDVQDETSNTSDLTTATVTATQAHDETSEAKTSPSVEEQQAQIKRLEAAISKANKDAKDHRLKNNDLEKTLAELKSFKEQIDAEKLSIQEKQDLERKKIEQQVSDLKAELDRKTNEVREQKINNDIFTKAARVGINPTLAQKVLDASDIDFDEKGNPTNIEDLLKSILKEYPNLAVTTRQSSSNGGGATNPTRSQTSGSQALSWDYIAKLSASDYAARSEEIQRWMNNPKNK